MMKVTLTILVIISALLFIGSCSLKNNRSVVERLTSEMIFPQKDDTVFISQPTNMVFDEQNNIYIGDLKGAKILKFDYKGRFIKQIGRKGQGPGELSLVKNVQVDDSILIVQNESKMQIYNKGEDFKASFPVHGYRNFWFKDEQIIAYKMNENPRKLLTEEGYDRKLLQVYNLKGEKTGEFGEMLTLITSDKGLDIFTSNYVSFDVYQDKLYVLYAYFPVLRVYDAYSYDLLEEITFEDPFDYASTRVSSNYTNEPFKEMGIKFKVLFMAFDVSSEGIFLGLYDDNILIDHYSLEGDFIKRYQKQYQNKPYYLYDLKVFEEPDQRKFYILENKNDIPLVEVFTVSK